MTLSNAENLEAVLSAALAADAQIGANPNTTIVVDPQKNIVAEVGKKVGMFGTVIVVYAFKASDDNSGVQYPFFDKVPFTVGIFQNPLLVTTGMTARAIAERVCTILKGNSGWSRYIELRDPAWEHIPDSKLNIYQVNGQTAVDGTSLTQLPAITKTVAGGNVTLACAQPGTAIFYRTDGTLPTTSDTLYTAPFASAGQKIAACAWLQGFLASPYLQFQT